jgi:tetratricopeptide (TPR) repeat protein
VFANGCTLEDAEAVARGGPQFLPDLEALVGWSLLRSDVADGSIRLSMLETVREHAVDLLRAEGRLDAVRERHADRFLALALDAENELAGPNQGAWLQRLELEVDNIRTALDWLLSSGRVADALRATSALSRFFRGHGRAAEARRWISLGLALADDIAPDLRADALWTAARQAAAQNDWKAVEDNLLEAVPLFRDAGRSREVVFALCELAFVAVRRNDLMRASALCEEALEVGRALNDARATSAALVTLAEVRSAQGDHQRALALDEEAVVLRRSLGDPLLVTDAVHNLGWVAFLAGDFERARAAYEESLALARDLADTLHSAEALRMLGELDLFGGDADSAEERIQESLTLFTDVGADLDRAACLTALGGVAALRGKQDEAERLFGEASALRGVAAPEAPEQAVLSRFQTRATDRSGEPARAE